MCKKIKVIVSGLYALPLHGIIDGVNQINHCKQQSNYLAGGSSVTIKKKKSVTYKLDDSSVEETLWAYKIDGVNGWFSVNNFNYDTCTCNT